MKSSTVLNWETRLKAMSAIDVANLITDAEQRAVDFWKQADAATNDGVREYFADNATEQDEIASIAKRVSGQ